MAEQKSEITTGKKLDSFLTKNKKVLIVVIALIICCVAGYIIGTGVSNSSSAKGLAAIDQISYELTNESASLDSAALEAKRADAFEKIKPYTSKGGIVGARANMLCAELTYQQGKYAESAEYWKTVISKAKKAYTAPIANYNLGVCYEELGKIDEACEAYKKAADDETFVLNAHAKFSYARCLEEKGDYKAAFDAYTELNDKSPDDSWAKLAKTRILLLKVMNKVE